MGRMHNDEELDGLFASYREACPDPESSPELMPKLWQKIETRRVDAVSIFKRLTHVCMAATVALLLLTAVLTPAMPDDETLYSSTYEDVLAADHADAAYQEALPAEMLGEVR